MAKQKKVSLFSIVNVTILSLISLTCILPVINLLALSLSGSAAATSGVVGLIPKDFTLDSYRMVIVNKDFWRAFLISVERVVLAILITTTMTILVAYPLSQNSRKFKSRTFYAWLLFIPSLSLSARSAWIWGWKARILRA